MTKRVAIVTGGIGGLGTAMCKALADQGRVVVAAYYPAEADKAAQWQEQRAAEGYDIKVYPVDVSSFESCAEMVAKVEADLGPVDILVNNAGITRDAMLRKMTYEQWNAVISTNLNSLFNMTKQVFEKMCERGWGRIVNISSVNGQKGQAGQANYASAKAGVHGFSMSVAQEGAAKGVTANTISPGYIGTEMVMAIREDVRAKIVATVPVGRFGKPEEIARGVAFLTDEEAGYITGADLSINGGLYYH